MKKIQNIIPLFALIIFIGCDDSVINDSVDFLEVQNPNLNIESILGSENSASLWAEGLDRQVSIAYNEVVELAELGSDNYVNTQTFYSQLFDGLDIRTVDVAIRGFERVIGVIRSSSRIGLESVGPADPNYTSTTEAEFNYYLGISHLLSGMYFSTHPNGAGTAPISSEEHLGLAITSFTNAVNLNAMPEYHLAAARANYLLGNREEAISSSNAALALSTDFLRVARYDNANGPTNTFEAAIFGRGNFDDLQPLPTLDFLDPKYSFLSADVDASINYLKAEEAYLILAEANLANDNLSAAQENLRDLLDLIATREVRTFSDTVEDRSQIDPGGRPDNENVVVNGRANLVLDRQAGNVSVPSVSGTSLTNADIDNMMDDDDALELLYRTRQEVFIAEGLRFVDMGVKMVITESEFLQNDNINEGDPGTIAVIPPFIASVATELDAFTYDAEAGTATTAINLNEILVENKNSDFVLPFE